jgi:hypothetical protein
MADDPVDTAVKDIGAATVGGVAGGAILAPLAVGVAGAIGLAVAPWAVIPVFGLSVLTGMWAGKKVRDASKGG